MIYDLIVVGGGAAGFYGAIQAAEANLSSKILIVEKSPKLLSKVRVSGGGRCNVTHHCFEASKLSTHYPRGQKPLKEIFKSYQSRDVVAWFQSKGVELKTEEDGRMFPASNTSETIIDCLMKEASSHNIKIVIGNGIDRIEKTDEKFSVTSQKGETFFCKNILIAIGGSPNALSYDMVVALGHSISAPIPSLFTFNDSVKSFKDLMGISVSDAEIKIVGTKFSNSGPLLITHWGLSGPAVIKLSAWAAEYLYNINYNFTILVSWIGPFKEVDLRNKLIEHKNKRGKQKVWNNAMFSLPQRLWIKLCEQSEIPEQIIWAEMPQKNINKLIENLIRCPFNIKGKTTFKEEFVTCGGVNLNEVNMATMESKIVKGLFFAGEVLNIDGETGGFNFQAAWSTAYLAARNLSIR